MSVTSVMNKRFSVNDSSEVSPEQSKYYHF